MCASQGTKACLGWDRVTAVLTTGTTAVVDLWLQLLLRTIQAAGAVKAHLAGRQAEAAAAAQVGWRRWGRFWSSGRLAGCLE